MIYESNFVNLKKLLNMIKKIKRDICIIKYRNFPLHAYDSKLDEEIFHYPKYKYFYWFKLKEEKTKKPFEKKLISEFCNLLEKMQLKDLIFLNGNNKPWVSKFTSERKDSKALTKSLEFFKSNKINKKFNGGIHITSEEFQNFLTHFFTLTCCDSGFFNYHFMDLNQNFTFYIHYSGEIQVLIMDKNSNIKFLTAIKETDFIDSHRDNTNRLNP